MGRLLRKKHQYSINIAVSRSSNTVRIPIPAGSYFITRPIKLSYSSLFGYPVIVMIGNNGTWRQYMPRVMVILIVPNALRNIVS